MRIIVFLCLSVFFIGDLFAQEESKKVSTESLLPEINPRDIEIRGVFKASFPGVRRQPILGFKPKPRVYQVDPNRFPFIEKEREAIVQYPINAMLQSERMPYLAERSKPTTNGYLALGGANYETFGANAAATIKNSKTQLDANLRFFDTNGHLNSPASAAFQEYGASLNLGHRIRSKQKLYLHSDYNYADLFQTINPINSIQNFKTTSQIKSILGYESYKNPVHKNRIHFGFSQFESELNNATIGAGVIEQIVEGEARFIRPTDTPEKTWAILVGAEIASYDQRNSSLSIDENKLHDWHNIYSVFNWRYRLNDQTLMNISTGIAQYSDFRTNFGIAPLFNFNANTEYGPYLKFNLLLKSELVSNRLSNAQLENPFIEVATLLPISRQTQLAMQFNVQPLSSTSFFINLSYAAWRQFTFFQRAGTPSILADGQEVRLFEQQYFNRLFIPQAEITYQQYLMNQKIRFNSTVTYRQAESDDNLIPAHIPNWEIRSQIFYQFDNQWNTEWTFLHIGDRYRNPINTSDSNAQKEANQLDAYSLLSTSIQYKWTDTWHFRLQALNLLNRNYIHWDGFTERGREIMFEVRYIF